MRMHAHMLMFDAQPPNQTFESPRPFLPPFPQDGVMGPQLAKPTQREKSAWQQQQDTHHREYNSSAGVRFWSFLAFTCVLWDTACV